MPHYDRYYPDYLRKYPGIERRPEVLRELRKSDRKMKYIEDDLKSEGFIEDQKKEIAEFIPSREDSYERLLEEEKRQFSDGSDLEELVLLHDDILKLRRALLQLEDDELVLIEALYFKELSERQMSLQTGIPQKTINDRKRKIIAKLNKFFK